MPSKQPLKPLLESIWFDLCSPAGAPAPLCKAARPRRLSPAPPLGPASSRGSGEGSGEEDGPASGAALGGAGGPASGAPVRARRRGVLADYFCFNRGAPLEPFALLDLLEFRIWSVEFRRELGPCVFATSLTGFLTGLGVSDQTCVHEIMSLAPPSPELGVHGYESMSSPEDSWEPPRARCGPSPPPQTLTPLPFTTLLIRKRSPLGPYSKSMPGPYGGPGGGGSSRASFHHSAFV